MRVDFSRALQEVKAGKKIAREGWNGKRMWLLMIADWTIGAEHASTVAGLLPLPFIAMKTADDGFVPWLASQTDILAIDWVVLP
jgi:hypothetical protein